MNPLVLDRENLSLRDATNGIPVIFGPYVREPIARFAVELSLERIAACVNACKGIETEDLIGKRVTCLESNSTEGVDLEPGRAPQGALRSLPVDAAGHGLGGAR